MPIKASAKKALRQSRKRALRNKRVKEKIRYLIKKTKKAIEAKNKTEALKWLKEAIKAIDKAAGKGIIKKNNAARKKSRLTLKFNKIFKIKSKTEKQKD